MEVEHRGKSRWQYKERAISQFAAELAPLLRAQTFKFALAAIPSSKRRDDLAHDDRLDAVIRQVCSSCSNAISCHPIVRKTSIRSAHTSGGNRPKPTEVRQSLEWGELPKGIDKIIFLDDVITTGTTYKECQSLVAKHTSQVVTIGLFWARTVWDPPGET